MSKEPSDEDSDGPCDHSGPCLSPKRTREEEKRKNPPEPSSKRRRKEDSVFRMIRTIGREGGGLFLLPASVASSVEDVTYSEFCRLLQKHHKKDEIAYSSWQCPCSYGNERVFQMSNIKVKKSMRRQGIGTFVLRHILNQVVPKCFPGATFLSGDFNSNALDFWRANGLIRVTPEIVEKEEPQLHNYTWCIRLLLLLEKS